MTRAARIEAAAEALLAAYRLRQACASVRPSPFDEVKFAETCESTEFAFKAFDEQLLALESALAPDSASEERSAVSQSSVTSLLEVRCGQGQEVLRIAPNGDVYLRGVLISVLPDGRAADGLTECFATLARQMVGWAPSSPDIGLYVSNGTVPTCEEERCIQPVRETVHGRELCTPHAVEYYNFSAERRMVFKKRPATDRRF